MQEKYKSDVMKAYFREKQLFVDSAFYALWWHMRA